MILYTKFLPTTTSTACTGSCKRNIPLFENYRPSAAGQLGQPIHSQSAIFGKFMLNLPNLAPFLLLNSVQAKFNTNGTGLQYVVLFSVFNIELSSRLTSDGFNSELVPGEFQSKKSSLHTSASHLRRQFRRCHGIWSLLSCCNFFLPLLMKMHFCRFNRWNGAPIEGNMCQSYLHRIEERSRNELMSMVSCCCIGISSVDIFQSWVTVSRFRCCWTYWTWH